MAAEALLLFVLMMSSVRVGKTTEALFRVRCEPAVGVVGQITHVVCSIESISRLTVNLISLTRAGEEQRCVVFDQIKKSVWGNSRFKVENEPSLQLHDTAVSDEGEYEYYIRTSQGAQKTRFTINVTAKYSEPVISSAQEELKNDRAVDLLCNSSRGYPAGNIHWFDQSNTNWTKSATLQRMQGNDGLFNLSSKLSFNRLDSLWAPFRCVVLSSTYAEEGWSTSSSLKIKEDAVTFPPEKNNSVLNNSVAAVVVIGSLIVGLLIVVLLKRRNDRRFIASKGLNPEEEYALNDPVDKKSSETDPDIGV